jgi:hypothetical protein
MTICMTLIINYYFESYVQKVIIIYEWGMWLVDDKVITRWGMLVFITFISSIWHPWLMTKWHGCPIVITMIKKWLQVIWHAHRDSYPQSPPTYVPTYLLTHPPTYLPTNPPTYLLAYLHTHPPTYPPTIHLLTYLLTYLPNYPPTHLPTYFVNLLVYLFTS